MKNFSIFGQKFETIPFFFVSLCVVFLICLGNWQLKRLKEKENFITTIDLNIKNPPVKITKAQTTLDLYSKIELTGQFLDGKNVFLYGRRSAYPEKDGYYFLSPFSGEASLKYPCVQAAPTGKVSYFFFFPDFPNFPTLTITFHTF